MDKMITFKQYLKESPQFDKTPKEQTTGMAEQLRDNIQHLDHDKSQDIGNGCRKHIGPAGTAYYHLTNGKVREFSFINHNGVHRATDKGPNGDVKYIHKFLKHHTKHVGPVQTHHINSAGAVHLWGNLIKSNPQNKKFHVVNKTTGERTEVNHKNIDSKKHDIWGDESDKQNIAIEMSHKK